MKIRACMALLGIYPELEQSFQDGCFSSMPMQDFEYFAWRAGYFKACWMAFSCITSTLESTENVWSQWFEPSFLVWVSTRRYLQLFWQAVRLLHSSHRYFLLIRLFLEFFERFRAIAQTFSVYLFLSFGNNHITTLVEYFPIRFHSRTKFSILLFRWFRTFFFFLAWHRSESDIYVQLIPLFSHKNGNVRLQWDKGRYPRWSLSDDKQFSYLFSDKFRDRHNFVLNYNC